MNKEENLKEIMQEVRSIFANAYGMKEELMFGQNNKVDLGFWDEKGVYKEDLQEIDNNIF